MALRRRAKPAWGSPHAHEDARLPNWLYPVLLAPFVGSFLGVLIRRLPAGEAVAIARSRCDNCGQTLRPRDLAPVVSYIAAGGRCRHCGAPIGRFHLVVELAAMAIALWAASLDAGPRLWADCFLGWCLLALAWIDARHMLLPDALTLPLILAGLGFAFWLDPASLPDRAVGAVVGWTLFWAISRLYRATRGRDGLGAGDAKLLAAGGAWVSWAGLAPVMLISAISGIGLWTILRLASKRESRAIAAATPIPFGPPLALAIWLVWLYGPFA
jgi:leader peptidase (prepilin peptidase)/N-methyltransferase